MANSSQCTLHSLHSFAACAWKQEAAAAEPQWGLSGPHKSEGGGPSASGVGDAGASWRMKALRRAQAQAADRGEDVAAIVVERYGSLQQLKQGLDSTSAAHRESLC